ncbi:MAG: hypothetical protein HYZ38_08360 [Mycobacterium sp.]|nr:hypothetical protein [Mycobacterium sp.]
MIKYEWRESLSPTESIELADMLSRAADYDAEPEYTTIDFRDVEQAMKQPDPSFRHLLVWMLPHATAMGAPDQPERIAALLRIRVFGNGAGEAALVVDPRLRSIGIVTLLLERVGLDTSAVDGWLGTGVHTLTAWAQGNHPAAGRISNRFLIPRTRRVWKLIRATDSVREAAGAPVLEPMSVAALDDLGWACKLSATAPCHALREGGRVIGAVTLDLTPSSSEEFGSCATIRAVANAPNADAQQRRKLLDGAAAIAHDAGRTGLVVYVDSDDSRLVIACRLTNFQHDRTDVLLQLGGFS